MVEHCILLRSIEKWTFASTAESDSEGARQSLSDPVPPALHRVYHTAVDAALGRTPHTLLHCRFFFFRSLRIYR